MTSNLLRSSLCTESTLTSEPFLEWASRTRPTWDEANSGVPVLTHRKLWEWMFIAQALFERGKLAPGMRGIGFGVGQDMLTALFAGFGCEIVATDLDLPSATAAGWVESGQHSTELAQLNKYGLCDPEQFNRLVTFRTVDMNNVPADLVDFDFSWSACAFEHLGTISKGQEFLVRQMGCLKPGGTAVHTTEYNVSSNERTYAEGGTVLFRRRDIEWLVRLLRHAGHDIEVDFDEGNSPADRHVDTEPFTNTHLKVMVGEFVATSLGLIVEKPAKRPRRPLRALADPTMTLHSLRRAR
jgi:hypothetical protein